MAIPETTLATGAMDNDEGVYDDYYTRSISGRTSPSLPSSPLRQSTLSSSDPDSNPTDAPQRPVGAPAEEGSGDSLSVRAVRDVTGQ